MELKEKLRRYRREIYNDIVIDGKVMIKGARECDERLTVINETIPKNASILDVGCHLGYFTIQLAAGSKDRIVVGMEGNYQRAEIAGEIAKANRLKNVIILNNYFNEKIAQRWGNCCEAFNSILLLNVLHHCKKEEIKNIITGVKRLAPQIIIETPHLKEDTACGTKKHREMINNIQICGYEKEKIAETETHTLKKKGKKGSLKRPMYLYTNNNWSKEVLRPHYYHSSPSKHRHKIIYKNNKFVHKGKEWTTGVNVGAMAALNMIYPTKKMLFEMIKKELDKHKWPLYDINLWNLIYTSDGVKLIDYKDRLEQRSTKEQAMAKLSKQYDLFKKEGAKPLQVQNFKNWVKHVIVSMLGRYKNQSSL